MAPIYKSQLSPERVAARKEQAAKVAAILKEKKYMPAETVDGEVKWYYDDLAFHDFYFRSTPAEIIAQHVAAIYASKIVYLTTGKLEVSLDCETTQDYAMKAVATVPGGENPPCYKIENELSERYIANNFCVSSYVTASAVLKDHPIHARLYLATRGKFQMEKAPLTETDLKNIADVRFNERATDNTKQIYQEMMKEAAEKLTPVIKGYDFVDSNERRIVVAWNQHHHPTYFAEISHTFSPNNVYSTRKYCESFSNGMRIASFYLAPTDEKAQITPEQWENLMQDISYAYALPTHALGPFGEAGLRRNEAAYAFAAAKFAQTFVNRYDEDYHQISSILANVPGNQPKVLISNLRRRLRIDTFSEQAVTNAILGNLDLVKELYEMFSKRFNPKKEHPVGEQWEKMIKDMNEKIGKVCGTEFEQQVMKAMNNMNHYMVKTNFYRTEKAALIFRFSGKVISPLEYPQCPFGVFFVVGSEFRGFHVRFADIARGGIRVVKSANRQAYLTNVANIFDENYNLAWTQQKKNKDIPEGGSKGTILLNYDCQEAGERCFEKYVCSLMDVLVPECVQVDYTNRPDPEILFLGPDEYTADLMAWAVDYTKTRKYQVYKAVTTGKPPKYGGVPHDAYGMTTRSVHQFVVGTLNKLGVDESKIKKFQTGGPDGDLGSNEITISKDTTTAIVDGSGVVYDAAGLNREELTRLAHARKMVREFNKDKLSPKGFFVDINDRNVKLPDGTVVENGMAYRNNFHLNPLSTTELFVPCGGRPESVNQANLPQILTADGKCKWKWVVEGANLFFTQAARLEVEKLGVILFKDASANKGGVTSSSKEVTAALALSDEEFKTHMCCDKDGKLPEFYKTYVQDIIKIVETNAKDEFECLWKAHEETGTPYCELTDKVSLKINAVADGIDESSLWENKKLRDVVFEECLPPSLVKLIGLKKFQERVPQNYQKAIFCSYLGSQFVYKAGYNVGEFALFDFIRSYEARCH